MASGQYAAMLQLLGQLDDADWARPTDCTEWAVRDIAAHVTGAADEGAHLGVLLRHMRFARKAGGPNLVDQLNVAQLADRSTAAPPAIVEELARLAPKAVRARLRTPSLVRRRPVPGDDLPPGSNFAYLIDVIYSRDLWMHRIDIARACARPVPPDDGDREVVEQVVRDLGRFWTGPAVALHLTGPAGGEWMLGDGEPVAHVETDTVPYLRLLSGRQAEPQLTVSGDEAVRAAMLASRVVF